MNTYFVSFSVELGSLFWKRTLTVSCEYEIEGPFNLQKLRETIVEKYDNDFSEHDIEFIYISKL